MLIATHTTHHGSDDLKWPSVTDESAFIQLKAEERRFWSSYLLQNQLLSGGKKVHKHTLLLIKSKRPVWWSELP